MLGLAYLGLLKVRRLGTSGRYYVVVPPVPVVRSIAGRRVGFVAEGCDRLLRTHGCCTYLALKAKV